MKAKVCNAAKGGCGETFSPARPLQQACCPKCAQSFAVRRAEKVVALRIREDKARTRVALEALKAVPKLKKEAQHAFNPWIRQRDQHQPCISCGAPPPDLSGLHAGRDAGHYRSTGSADHLRFNEDNVHGQCPSCNRWGAGKVVEYRMGLLARIGPERTNALEFNREFIKWDRDQLREIRDRYRALWAQGNSK